MSIVFVVIAAVLLVYSFIMSQGDGYNESAGMAGIIGIVAFVIGALLHMRKRRNEQLEAMRGRRDE